MEVRASGLGYWTLGGDGRVFGEFMLLVRSGDGSMTAASTYVTCGCFGGSVLSRDRDLGGKVRGGMTLKMWPFGREFASTGIWAFGEGVGRGFFRVRQPAKAATTIGG